MALRSSPHSPAQHSSSPLWHPWQVGVLLITLATWLVPRPSDGTPQVISPGQRPSSGPGPTTALFAGVLRPATAEGRRIYVRGGRFRMGASASDVRYAARLCRMESIVDECDDTDFSLERPAHAVTVGTFAIDATEVTVEDFYRCVEVGRCDSPSFDRGGFRFDNPRLPVTFVTWQQASDYCLFRGARLPSEAEWERAARGGSHRRFPWGDTWNPRLANHGRVGITREDGRDGFAELAPVGSFPDGGTSSGIMDLAGNVSEWVADALAEYPTSGASIPGITGSSTAPPGRRVIRGGDFVSAAHWLRSSARRGRPRDYAGADVGFRCARDVRRERR